MAQFNRVPFGDRRKRSLGNALGEAQASGLLRPNGIGSMLVVVQAIGVALLAVEQVVNLRNAPCVS